MGRASSNKKVARAARAAGRPGAGRNLGWPLIIGSVVVLGITLIVLTVSSTDNDRVGPRTTDHWHAAYGIYDCDHFITPISDVGEDISGVHSHIGEPLIHLHPFATQYTGKNANLGTWGDSVGMELTDTSITAAGIDRENGDDCGGEPGKVQVRVWNDPSDTTGHLLEGDLADHAPQDSEILTIAFVPEGADVPQLPEASASLGAPSDVTGQPPVGSDTAPTDPPAETPLPVDPSATTTTPPGGTATAPAG